MNWENHAADRAALDKAAKPAKTDFAKAIVGTDPVSLLPQPFHDIAYDTITMVAMWYGAQSSPGLTKHA